MRSRRPRSRAFRTLAELEPLAARATDPAVWEYVQGGASAEVTLAGNARAFDRWSLVPRVLRDVRSVDLSTALLGQRVAAPLFAAPTAYHGALDPRGEVATARALARSGLLGVYSTLSSRSVEEIGRASGDAPHWFQLYPQPDERGSVELVRRAERAGFGAVVVTVDAPVLGPRDVQSHGGFALVDRVPLGNGPHVRNPARVLVERGGRYEFEPVPEYSWEAIGRLVEATDLPWVVKGILDPDDARAAVRLGAKGVVVSNHGGRQLDRSLPSLEALPEVVRAVGDRAEVYVDGGFRRSADVLVALALGATAVGLGRPVLWALSVAGEAGVERLARLLLAELATSMVLLGCSRPGEVGPRFLRDRRLTGRPGPRARSSRGRRVRA